MGLSGFDGSLLALALPVASPAMAAVPPSPQLLTTHGHGGDASVSLFLETDLNTRLAVSVPPDTTIRRLKSQVAKEHAAAFPHLGLVDVKSFQVNHKGVHYHLSESMTVTSACKKIKGGCFLHVKMSCSYQDALAIDRRRSNDAQELPATASASDMHPQSLEVLNNVQAHDASPNCILVPSSPQRNIEIKKIKVVGRASDTQAGFDQAVEKAKSSSGQKKCADQTKGAYISNRASMENVDKLPNQSNMSHAVDDPHARNMIQNPIGDGKKKKRKHQSESLRGVDPSQDMTKSSVFVTDECLVQCIDASPRDTKQTTLGNIEGATVIERNKQGVSLDMAVTNVSVVLGDLRSNGSLSKEFCSRRSLREDWTRDLLTGQSHLPRNQNALQVPESTADKVVGINAALSQKYPAAVHSDAPVSSLGHKKSKRKRPKGLSTMIDSSHPSTGAPEDLNRENGTAKNGKEKKKRKRKSNMEVSAAEKENPNCDNQGIDSFTQKSLISVVLKQRISQDDSAMQHDLEKILPDDVLSDILLCLPSVASLARAAMVSRSWHELATSASFLCRFHSRHLSPPFLGCFVSFMKQDDTFNTSYASHTFHHNEICSDHELTTAACGGDFRLMGLKEERHWRMTDCRGGFILLASREGFALFDPVSRSHINVSRPTEYNNRINPSSFHSCLVPDWGADKGTPLPPFRFRLVSIEEKGSLLFVHAYNHRASKWDTYGAFQVSACDIKAPTRFVFSGRGKADRSSFPSMYADGCVYWKYEEGNVLLSLDTRSMIFSHLALPPEPDLYREQAPFVVGENEDGTCCLVCVVKHRRGYVMQVWLRKGKAQSWILDMDVESSVMLACNMDLCLNKVRRVCAVNTGVVLLSLYHGSGQYQYMAFRLKDLYAAAALAKVSAPTSLQLEADFCSCGGLEAHPYLMAWPPSSLVQ